jgi:hypothetical protein
MGPPHFGRQVLPPKNRENILSRRFLRKLFSLRKMGTTLKISLKRSLAGLDKSVAGIGKKRPSLSRSGQEGLSFVFTKE